MGPQDIPNRDRQALGKHTANVRSLLTGPALGLLLAATLWLLMFSHFIYHSKYIATWTASGLLGGALAALIFATFFVWVGAVWKKSSVVLFSAASLCIAIGLCVAHIVVEQKTFTSPSKFSGDKQFEGSRLTFLVFKAIFVGLWLPVLLAAGRLFFKFRDGTGGRPLTWNEAYDDVLLSNGLLRPWNNDEISLNQNCLGKQFVSFLTFYALAEILTLCVLMIYSKEYDIFDENTWMVLLIGGCCVSLLTHANTCFGLWVEDETSLFLSSVLYPFSIALGLLGWLILYQTWEDSYLKEDMFIQVIGTALSATFSIVVAGVHGGFNAFSVQLAFRRRPKHCSPGQGCLISTTDRGRIKIVKSE